MRRMKRLRCASVVPYDQCIFQCRARKPTTLLLIRLPHLRDRIMRLSDHGRCSHHGGFHIGLHGKDEKGDFKTSIAKIYPVEMNAAIADSVVQCTVFTFCF